MWSSRRHTPTRVLTAFPLWAVLCVLLSASPLSGSGQNAFELICKNRNMAASNYLVYPDSVQQQLTPPPAGKKPFYISHYGRHGSRYLNNRKGYDVPYNMLCRADSMNALTPIGRPVRHRQEAASPDSPPYDGALPGGV